jgi:hypothetical protein
MRAGHPGIGVCQEPPPFLPTEQRATPAAGRGGEQPHPEAVELVLLLRQQACRPGRVVAENN